jgi:anti-sigma factor RsiW
MSCESRINDVSLYLYGELAAEDEERFEAHLDGCAECRSEVERAREIGRALDRRSVEPSAALLAECRQELMIAVHSEAPSGRLWEGLRGALGGMFGPAIGLRRLAAAAALVTLGFVAARFSLKQAGTLSPGAASLADRPATAGFAVSGIHSEPGPSGQDQIVLDGTRTDQVSGPADDSQIQQYLLSAARNATNPGLRVESIEILKDHSGSDAVRRTLVRALAGDPNPGVRLMALQGLKSVAGEAEVHRALARALVADDNPGVRIQVIEILTERKDHELVGVLQDLVQNEDNNYVKIRCKTALREMKASEGPF